MAEILPEIETFAKIVVVGVGGGGGNAVNRMMSGTRKINGVEFVVVNTDAQALHSSPATKVHIGKEVTRGLGAGANPEIGRKAAEESLEDVLKVVKRADMVFLTGGLGGGTGSGAMPVIAKAIKEAGSLTVAIVTKPFLFEGTRRMRIAEESITNLKDDVDTLIVIPNERIIQKVDIKSPVIEAFAAVDEVLRQGIQGISDLITVEGLINLDFADVQSIMKEAGTALMGIGTATGENRAVLAARQAMDSPLLDVSIQGAKGVLINFTGGRDLGMHEINEASNLIRDAVDPEANIIFGAVIDENLTGEIRISLVATGFDVEYPNKVATNPFIGSHNYQPPNKQSSALGINNPFTLSKQIEEEQTSNTSKTVSFSEVLQTSTSDLMQKLSSHPSDIQSITEETTIVTKTDFLSLEPTEKDKETSILETLDGDISEVGDDNNMTPIDNVVDFDEDSQDLGKAQEGSLVSDNSLFEVEDTDISIGTKSQQISAKESDITNISSVEIDEDELEQPAFLRRK